MTEGLDPRLDAILEALLAYARHDFSHRAPVTGTDEIDAIATGLNMLAEELETTVARRRDLDAANAKLVEAGRMAAIGLVAAGVAHEVNNPAAWVSLALGMIRKSLGALTRRLDDPVLDRDAMRAELATMATLAGDCVEGMARISTVIGDLRSLSRAEDTSVATIELEEVVASCCRLASHRLGDARVDVDIDETPPLVANRGRVAQVLTNLLVNAAQALEESAHGERVIAIRVTARDGGTLLAVEDTGPGVPEHTRAHVFDPFFTTKPREGMGLGLTIVARIAASYGGHARVTDPLSLSGARVEVWFPSACAP